jgi:coproporphyrinogen III oxidase
MACSMPGAQDDPSYTSTSISLIIHPRSPRVPTVQMNARYFATTQYWFGGGADLTPMLKAQRSEAAPDAQLFHAHLRRACDAFDTAWYSSYKAWCDRYFFLPHRNQTRGVGGIFFDHHNSGDFERDLSFTSAVGSAFLNGYSRIVRSRMSERWSEEERQEQLRIRGLYVEFNLLYDGGTMFGLKVGGNVETIMSSMPPSVTWD